MNTIQFIEVWHGEERIKIIPKDKSHIHSSCKDKGKLAKKTYIEDVSGYHMSVIGVNKFGSP